MQSDADREVEVVPETIERSVMLEVHLQIDDPEVDPEVNLGIDLGVDLEVVIELDLGVDPVRQIKTMISFARVMEPSIFCTRTSKGETLDVCDSDFQK